MKERIEKKTKLLYGKIEGAKMPVYRLQVEYTLIEYTYLELSTSLSNCRLCQYQLRTQFSLYNFRCISCLHIINRCFDYSIFYGSILYRYWYSLSFCDLRLKNVHRLSSSVVVVVVASIVGAMH